MTFYRSAPDIPRHLFAISSRLTSYANFLFLECTLRILYLPYKSGNPTYICLSNLPGLNKALSRTSGIFVAANIIIPVLPSKPSISVKS